MKINNLYLIIYFGLNKLIRNYITILIYTEMIYYNDNLILII